MSALEQVTSYEHVAKVARPSRASRFAAPFSSGTRSRPRTPPCRSSSARSRGGTSATRRSAATCSSAVLGPWILHRCGDDFYFLLVSTWQNENELWETVWAKDGSESFAFRPWSVEGTHRPTFCVWELGPSATSGGVERLPALPARRDREGHLPRVDVRGEV